MAKSEREALSGIGKKNEPSRRYGESFSKTCSTFVVATCASMRVVIFTDLMLRARGSGRGMGTGSGGQRWHSEGMMTPCARAALPPHENSASRASILSFIGHLVLNLGADGSQRFHLVFLLVHCLNAEASRSCEIVEPFTQSDRCLDEMPARVHLRLGKCLGPASA